MHLPHQTRRRTKIVLAALIIGCLPTGPGQASSQTEVVKLPEAAYDFAIDPETGTLAAVVPDADKVVFYPNISKDRRASDASAVKVGQTPVGIVYKRLPKRTLCAVVSHGSKEMTLIDPADRSVVKVIALTLDGPSSVTASVNPNDPYVYYFGGRGHDSRVARVNLETLTNEGTVHIGSERAMDGAVSGDGHRLYIRGPSSPSGFQVYELPTPDIEPKPAQARQIRREHTDCAGYLPDPFNQFVVCGSQVWTVDLGKKTVELPVAPSFISATRPVMLGLGDDSLAAVSTNTFKAIGSTRLPSRPPPPEKLRKLAIGNPQADFKNFRHRVRILEHSPSASWLVCWESTVAVVPFDALALPDEPFLGVKLEGEQQAFVGRRQAIRVVSPDSGLKIEIVDGPRALQLEGSDLVWTPTDTHIGTHRVVLKVSAKGVTKSQELTLVVRRPSVEIPFNMQQSHVNTDGSAAALLGSDFRSPARPHHHEATRVAVVDLEGMKIVAERKMLVAVRAIALDTHFVYVASTIRTRSTFLIAKTLPMSSAFSQTGAFARLCRSTIAYFSY